MTTKPKPPSLEPTIYLLPNLMTAGNLFCGFMAVLQIFNGMTREELGAKPYLNAIAFILGACLFDVLDGRFARIRGQASAFGREFDSLADIISFGFAPAMLVHAVVLKDLNDRIGWFISFIYLLCGAMRLARFNCISAMAEATGFKTSRDFLGLPIPAAAGVIASITMLLLWLEGNSRQLNGWQYLLPFFMLAVSFLMFSRVTYPSFKKVDWKSRHSIPGLLIAILVVAFTILNWEWMPAVLFLSYLIYGLVRPWVSGRWRKEIEMNEEPTADGEWKIEQSEEPPEKPVL